jgi:hypothetical protein
MQASRIAALLVLATAISFGASWQLASAQAEKAKPAQKWEYVAINGGAYSPNNGDAHKELEKLGEQGWELVAVEPAAPYVQGGQLRASERIYHLKRAK